MEEAGQTEQGRLKQPSNNPRSENLGEGKSTESVAPLVWKKRKRTLVRIGDLVPSTGEVVSKKITIGGVHVVPKGRDPLETVPLPKKPSQVSTVRTFAAMMAAARKEQQLEIGEPELYMSGWKHIGKGTWLENEKERKDWVSNALPPAAREM